MRIPQPKLGPLPEHQMKREIGLMDEFELQKALNQPRAYAVGPREKRSIRQELTWRQQERTAAAQAHENELQSAGFDNGFSVDITEGIPDPIADPLPDPVVNHVGTVTTGNFRPEPLPGNEPLPNNVVTPEQSPLDAVPFKNPRDVSISEIHSENGINVSFEVSFVSGFDSDFDSNFESELDY